MIATTITSGDSPKYRAKLYRVRISDAKSTGIWYAGKKGSEYWTVLSVRHAGQTVPVFRVVEFDGKQLSESTTRLFIHPADCEIQQEVIYKSCTNIIHFIKL